MPTYLQVAITAPQQFHEILVAELAELNYDSFQENDDSLDAYILQDEFSEAQLKEILDRYSNLFASNFKVSELEEKNWNEEWEKNFDPVFIDSKCVIRANFHQPYPDYKYEIVINPKMSFGTGHHSTTALMIRHLLDMDIENKKLFDAGTGTGVLAIMAHKLGASEIHACDIDEWPYENSLENFGLNKAESIHIEQCTFPEYKSHLTAYNVILANINKNVLLDEIPHYSKSLLKNGYLVLSGFYTEDIKDIENEAQKNGLKLVESKDHNNWAALLFSKVG